MRYGRQIAIAIAIVITSLGIGPSASADGEEIRGVVTDGLTGVALADVCVTLGPPLQCFTRTDASGFYSIDLAGMGARPGYWELHFLKTGYQTAASESFFVGGGPVTFNQVLMPTGQRALCPTPRSESATDTVYLPNITKTLGGAGGWQTPFIVQNVGTSVTALEVTYYRFLTGKCAVRRVVESLRPGTSFADVPNNDHDLPGDTQFSVVVRSFGSAVVSVVNQHAGGGERAEALSYVGVSRGATSAFVPNVVRRFYGYVSPIVIQNLGVSDANVNVRFTSFDGSAADIAVLRQIPPGGSKFIDPNTEPGLVDGKQYTARVSSNEPVSVVVNTHNDAPSAAAPVAYSTNGITAGAPAVHGPYAARNGGSEGLVTTIVVHNLSLRSLRPSLQFDTLGSAEGSYTFVSPTEIAPGRAWAFDPRFALGTSTPCTGQSATCLGDGEYTVVARSNDPDSAIAVAVNVIGRTQAMGYTAVPVPATSLYLPNVTRTLGGRTGWTTPILLQAAGSGTTSATLRWYRFSDGAQVHVQSVPLTPGRGVRVDPRLVQGLSDDSQYSVVIEGVGGTVAAIVMQLAAGGDNAMIYEGFATQPPR